MKKIFWEKYLKKQTMKSSLPHQKTFEEVRRIGMLETMVKVLQVCLNVHI